LVAADGPSILLRRLELETPKSAKERFTAALVLGALRYMSGGKTL
jgi:hypothetical protein